MFFDTHAHYDDEQYDIDREDILKQMYENGVDKIVTISVDLESAAACSALADSHEFIYSSVGFHPHNVSKMKYSDIDSMRSFATKNKMVAVGEIGLDYYYDHSPRDEQKLWFSRQLAFASEIGKPVIIHDRDAHADTLDIIRAERNSSTEGVFHCYSGSVEMAREVLNMNFYISIAGPVTFKNVKKLVEVVKYLPEDRILIETDSPYLSPEPLRGRRNNSGNLSFIASRIAEIRETTIEHIAEITSTNAKRLFKIN